MSIVIENPRDPEAKSGRGGGVGLENVRRRLAVTFPGAARMDAAATTDHFRVEIDLPCITDD